MHYDYDVLFALILGIFIGAILATIFFIFLERSGKKIADANKKKRPLNGRRQRWLRNLLDRRNHDKL